MPGASKPQVTSRPAFKTSASASAASAARLYDPMRSATEPQSEVTWPSNPPICERGVEKWIYRARGPLQRIIGGHNHFHASVSHDRLERREIRLIQVRFGRGHVSAMPAAGLGAAVHGKMLGWLRPADRWGCRPEGLGQRQPQAGRSKKGSSPYVSCPRPQRGSRNMLMLGDQKVSPWNIVPSFSVPA